MKIEDAVTVFFAHYVACIYHWEAERISEIQLSDSEIEAYFVETFFFTKCGSFNL